MTKTQASPKARIHTPTIHHLAPVFGEIRDAKACGKSGTNNYIWMPCVQCGKERWTRFAKGIPRTKRCRYCGDRCRTGPAKHVTKKGYTTVYLYPEDFFYSMAGKSGYVFEHRLVMAKHLGRLLHQWEFVHHKNGMKGDNRIENLQLITSETHNAISILTNKMRYLEERITRLEFDNTLLRRQLNDYQGKSAYTI